jgi:hypothetical protein
MYQHPAALDMNASHYQHEALQAAKMRRLVAEAHGPEHHGVVMGTTPFQRRLVAIAVALVTVLGAVALI